MIMFFSLMGVYLVSFNTFDIQILAIIAVSAAALRLLAFPMAPLLLGFILGSILEYNLRRAVTLADGQWSFLWERPITLCLILLTLVVLFSPFVRKLVRR